MASCLDAGNPCATLKPFVKQSGRPQGEKTVMQMQVSVEINCPIEEVFEYTTQRVSDWSKTVVEDQVIEDVNNGDVGTLFRCVTEDQGRRMEFRGNVIEHEPPRKSVVHLAGQYFDIVADYTFEDLRGRTRVTQDSEVIGKGFVKVMFLLFGWLMKSAGCKRKWRNSIT